MTVKPIAPSLCLLSPQNSQSRAELFHPPQSIKALDLLLLLDYYYCAPNNLQPTIHIIITTTTTTTLILALPTLYPLPTQKHPPILYPLSIIPGSFPVH